MEVIGVLASIVQIADTALNVAGESKKLYRAYKMAPNAIQDAEKQAESVQQVIDDLNILCKRFKEVQTHHVSQRTDGNSRLANGLEQLSGALKQLDNVLKYRYKQSIKAKDKWLWAKSDKSRVDAAQQKIESARSALSLSLIVLLYEELMVSRQCILAEQTYLQKSFDRLSAKQDVDQTILAEALASHRLHQVALNNAGPIHTVGKGKATKEVGGTVSSCW